MANVFTPPLHAKQMEVFNCRKPFLLVNGPRLCGKTVGTMHRLMRHAWETPEARIGMFTKTIKNAKSGVWADMTQGSSSALSIWNDANIGSEFSDFELTVPPKQDGATRTHFFQIRNYFGTESRIELHSLDFDGDVEKVVFGTRFSAIYFSELQHFHDKRVFEATSLQLRMMHLSFDQHLWISDTNPPEEGPEHFAFPLFFQNIEPERYPLPKGVILDPGFVSQFGRIDFTINDNPSLSAAQVLHLKEMYKDDSEAYDRFVLGLWTSGLGKSTKHFAMSFKPEIHSVGSVDSADQNEWEYLNPLPSCFELVSGWDIGDVNHAWVALQKRTMDNGFIAWDIIEEVVSIGESLTTEAFTDMVLEKREAIEKQLGRTVEWTDWSDTSAFQSSSKGADLLDALIVERTSDASIQLRPATNCKKPRGIQNRVKLIKQLLNEHRLFISAHCVNVINMMKSLPRGTKERDFVPRGNRHKHVFDAMSYAIFMEMLDELESGDNPNVPQVGGRLVSV